MIAGVGAVFLLPGQAKKIVHEPGRAGKACCSLGEDLRKKLGEDLRKKFKVFTI
jgi:hypothetical protein